VEIVFGSMHENVQGAANNQSSPFRFVSAIRSSMRCRRISGLSLPVTRMPEDSSTAEMMTGSPIRAARVIQEEKKDYRKIKQNLLKQK